MDLPQSDIQRLYDLQIDMVFSSVLTAAELEFLRTSSWFMVSISDSLHCFSFGSIKNGSTAI